MERVSRAGKIGKLRSQAETLDESHQRTIDNQRTQKQEYCRSAGRNQHEAKLYLAGQQYIQNEAGDEQNGSGSFAIKASHAPTPINVHPNKLERVGTLSERANPIAVIKSACNAKVL